MSRMLFMHLSKERNAVIGVFLASLLISLCGWSIETLVHFLFMSSNHESFTEALIPLQDSHELYMRIQFTLFIILAGNVVGNMILRLRRNSEKLRESEKRLHLALEAKNDGVWDWNLVSNETFFDECYYTMAGYKPYEFPQNYKSWLDHVHPDDLPKAKQAINEYLANKCPIYDVEFRFKHKDGSWMWIHARGKFSERDESARLIRMVGTHTDITARKRAEDALRQSIEHSRELVESITETLWSYRVDRTGNLVEETISSQVEKWLEIPEGAIGNRFESFFSYAPENDRKKAYEKLEYLLSHPGEVIEVEYRLISPSGKVIWVQSRGRGTQMDDGTIKAFGSTSNITEQKLSERMVQLRLQLMEYSNSHSLEELLQFTLDQVSDLCNSPIAFYHFVNDDQKTLSLQAWSTKTMRHFCKAQPTAKHYSIDHAGVWVDCVRTRTPVIHNDYKSLPHKKGLPEGHAEVIRELVVPVMKGDKIVAILGIGNKPTLYSEMDTAIVSFLADVTWEIVLRKRTDDALRESEAKLSALFASMTEMVVLHELVFNEDGKPINYRITDCNVAFSRITGISREHAVGKLATEAYGTPKPPYLDIYAKVAMTGEPYHYESWFAPMDKYFDISVVSPGLHRFATVSSDITEFKRIQAIIDAKNKELEQIVYVASHDLRSPLVNVEGFSGEIEYTLQELSTKLDSSTGSSEIERSLHTEIPDMVNSIGRIRTSTRQMDKLLKGLLQLSRQGKVALKIETVNMNDCIAQLVASFSYMFKEYEVELDIGDLPPCRGDIVQITQVFANLISNAIKYRSPSRPLKLYIRGTSQVDRSSYEIEDNGIGIVQSHLESIFELFHRLEPNKTEGDGLGLTIARQALSRMNGIISVQSELGKGSVFLISLPPARSL